MQQPVYPVMNNQNQVYPSQPGQPQMMMGQPVQPHMMQAQPGQPPMMMPPQPQGVGQWSQPPKVPYVQPMISGGQQNQMMMNSVPVPMVPQINTGQRQSIFVSQQQFQARPNIMPEVYCCSCIPIETSVLVMIFMNVLTSVGGIVNIVQLLEFINLGGAWTIFIAMHILSGVLFILVEIIFTCGFVKYRQTPIHLINNSTREALVNNWKWGYLLFIISAFGSGGAFIYGYAKIGETYIDHNGVKQNFLAQAFGQVIGACIGASFIYWYQSSYQQWQQYEEIAEDDAIAQAQQLQMTHQVLSAGVPPLHRY